MCHFCVIFCNFVSFAVITQKWLIIANPLKNKGIMDKKMTGDYPSL